MNHNGVISLPLKTGEALVAGTAIEIHNNAQAAEAKSNTNIDKAIGVILQDAKQADSGLPAAVQLYSAGGCALVLMVNACNVGDVIYIGTTGKHTCTKASNKAIGVALEESTGDNDVIRVALGFAV